MAGRPSKYNPEFNNQVEKLCKLGATDSEMADFFGVAESTINLWKIHEPEFSESIKKGKIIADMEVGERLFQRACGYEHPEEEIKVVSMGGGEGSTIERVEVTKHYPPDTAAAFIWLKNRRGWKDKQEIEIFSKVAKIADRVASIVQKYVPADKIKPAAEELKAAFNELD